MRRFFTLHDPVLPVHHPRVVLQTAIEQGASAEILLHGTGLSQAMFEVPETRMSYEQFALLIRNALSATGNPALGLDVGQRLHLTHMGVLGLALMSSPTIGEALDAALRQVATVAPALTLELERGDDQGCVRIGSSIPLGNLAIFVCEMTLAAIDTQGRFLFGDKLPVVGVRLPYRRPAHFERYLKLYDVPFEFEADAAEVLIDVRLLDAPIPFADPNTARIAERTHAQLFPPATVTGGLIGQVQQVLDASEGEAHDLEHVARKLQTSGRSLRRALQEMGTSFQVLRDASRRERALEWASTTDMTFEDIARRLGFSDVRSFRRAFKRWTGELPGAVRRQARGE